MKREISLITLLFIGFVVFLFDTPTYSQTTPPDIASGDMPSSTYFESEFDSVDTVTGRLHLHIPLVVDHSQRGDLNFIYSVSSSGIPGWEVICIDNYYYGCKWITGDGFGGLDAPTPIMDGSLGGPGGNFPYWWQISSVVEGDGSQHVYSWENSETVDGSGIQIASNAMINNRGVSFMNNFPGASSSIVDRNGNKMTMGSSQQLPFWYGEGTPWTMTDTLGRSWSLSNAPNTSKCPSGVPATSAEFWNTPGPTGGTRQFVLCYYNGVTITTNFANPNPSVFTAGITQYNGVIPIPVLAAVVLPDGTNWKFKYNQGGDTSGNVTEVDLPSGGSISYTYSAISNPCYSGPSGAWYIYIVASRTVSDGVSSPHTWNYTYGREGVGNAYTDVIVTDPLLNDTDYVDTGSTCGPVGTVKSYAGSHSGGTLLQTVTKGYSYYGEYSGANPQTPAILPSSATTSLQSGQVSETAQSYDSGFSYWLEICTWDSGDDQYDNCTNHEYTVPYGLVTSSTQYDYGTSSPGPVISKKSTTYRALQSGGSSYVTANLLSLPASETVMDVNGYLCAETDYGYDESSVDSSGVSEQHGSAPFSVRGNLTSTTRKLFTNPCSTSSPSATSLTTTIHVYDTGKLHTSTDPRGNSTTLLYSSTYYGAYPTTVTNALSQLTSYTYDFNTGLVATITDPNNAVTTYSSSSHPYDCMLRLTEVDYPDGGKETAAYNYSGGTPCGGSTGLTYSGATTTKSITSSLALTTTLVFDGQGREKQSLSSVPTSTCSGGSVFVDKTYDADGRLYTISNPDCTSTSTDDVNKTYSYDALNRLTTLTDQDGGTVATAYADLSSHVLCGTVTDEARKVLKSCSDGAGRMTHVWEDPSGLNYETDYSYNANGDLTQVVQEGSHTRSFSYDSLSSLVIATNPESGTICYGTVSGTCQQNGYDGNGNLIYRTDARGIQTTYSYDAINRITGKTYSNGDLSVNYSYDGVAPTGCTIPGSFSYGSYPKTHRTAMCDAAGNEAWRFDIVGRVAIDQRTTNAITKTSTYTPNYDGSIASIIYPGGSTIMYTPNVAEQATTAVDTTNSINYASGPTTCPNGQSALTVGSLNGACYNPDGSMASLKNGVSIISALYENNRLQPCRTVVINSSGTLPTSCTDSTHAGNVLDFGYNFDLSSVNSPCSTSFSSPTNNGDMAAINNNKPSSSSRSQNFCYDSLNRLKQAQTTSTFGTSPANCWSELYSYDSWGNLTSIAAPSGTYPTNPYGGCTEESGFSTTANSNNQLTISGLTYDTAGSLTNNGSLSFLYDAEGRICSVGGISCATGTTYVYDGDGTRVEKTATGTAYKIYWHDTSGNVLDETDGTGSSSNSNFTEYVFFNGQRIAKRNSTSTVNYYFADHLGTSRVLTDANGDIAPLDDIDFYPFGGERNVTGPSSGNNYKFTGKERDSESGLDDFGARYDSSQYGRFMTPDPVTITTDRLYDPQQLNAYAYVRNNPLRFNDPTGEILQCISASTNDDQAANDRQQCFNDLKTIAGDAANRLSMDKTGVIGFDTTGLDVSKNEGATLVNDLVGSKNTYDFSIGPTVMTDKGPLKIDYIIANLPRFGDQPRGGNPPSGVSDIVALYFNNPNVTQVSNTNLKVAPDWTVAFHELAEAYEKIDGGKGGSYEQGHNAALQREMALRDQRPYLKEYNTGAGGPANSRNPQGGIVIKR